MKRYIIGFSVFLITQLIMSCTSCGCEKQNNVNEHFDINEMKVVFIKPTSISLSTDTSTQSLQFIKDSAEIASNELMFLVYFDIKYITSIKLNRFQLINTAYACSPIEIGEKGSIESIDSFYIVPVSGKFGTDSFYTDTLFTISNLNYTSYYYNSDTIKFNNPSYNSPFNYNSISYLVARPKLIFPVGPANLVSSFKTSNFEQLRVVLKLKNGERYEKTTTHFKLI
jgi:hypothetical protein